MRCATCGWLASGCCPVASRRGSTGVRCRPTPPPPPDAWCAESPLPPDAWCAECRWPRTASAETRLSCVPKCGHAVRWGGRQGDAEVGCHVGEHGLEERLDVVDGEPELPEHLERDVAVQPRPHLQER